MKKTLILLLVLVSFGLFANLVCAEPGDIAAAQSLAQPVAGLTPETVNSTVASVVTAALPLLPPPYAGLVPILLPLVGLATDLWWRWRKKSDESDLEKKRGRLLVDGIAYAEELSAAAKKTNQPMSGPATLQAAITFIADRDPKKKLFAGLSDIEQRVTSYLARIPHVGATGAQSL